jgi:starch synthase
MFADKLLLEGIEDEDVANLKNKDIDYVTLSKLAIDYSDGVIQSVSGTNPEIVEYIQSQQIKFLPFKEDEDYADDYVRFYDSVI